MESRIKNAWILAGVKMSLGLFAVAAAIGIRVVTATPVGGADPNADRAPAFEEAAAESETSAAAESGSPVGRAEEFAGEPAEVRDRPKRPGDKFVSCQVADRTLFMTADDCAVRGGSARESRAR